MTPKSFDVPDAVVTWGHVVDHLQSIGVTPEDRVRRLELLVGPKGHEVLFQIGLPTETTPPHLEKRELARPFRILLYLLFGTLLVVVWATLIRLSVWIWTLDLDLP